MRNAKGKPAEAVQEKFAKAVDKLIEQVKEDRSILGAILCGSLSHDKVWDKSDVDLVLVTIDDKKIEARGANLYADGINVHALLMPRSQFRKLVEGSLQNSFMHSFLAKGRLLYSHDESLEHLCGGLRTIGGRDAQIQLLLAGMWALAPLYKAHKFFVTRGDLEYTTLWLLQTVTPIARVEIIERRMLADREVIPQAMKLNPAFFKIVYSDLLNGKKTKKSVKAALDAIDGYLAERAKKLFSVVIDYLQEVGEVRSATEIEDYFRRNLGIDGVTAACEYLADQKLIGKASTPVQLTKRSNVSVQEVAFFYLEEVPDEF